jgi:putative tricarboxylic transport membrane protein
MTGVEDDNMTAAIALLVFGAATVLMSLNLPIGTLRAPGSGFFPLALGLMLAALSASQGVTLYLERCRQAQPAPVPPATPPSPWFTEGTRRVLIFMGAVALAIALLPTLGYALTSLILMLTLLRILGAASWPLIGAISAATAIACYLVFVRVLGIPLPTGWPGF